MAFRRVSSLVFILAAGVFGALVPAGLAAQAPALPASLSNEAFWALSQSLSESNGFFRSDNLVSNEVYYQTIIPELITTTRPGRVYLGVGPEQNFTYIAALKPRMVFLVDVRRGNLHLHLMYKALFELATDRAEFVSLLFSKKRPDGLHETSSPRELFAGLVGVETSEETYTANLKAILDHLTVTRQLPLDEADRKGIEYVYYHFYWFGPGLTYASSSSGGGRGNFVNYQTLMIADDGIGAARSFLAGEEQFRAIKALHEKNLVVPVVGNFAGSKALRGLGAWLAERRALVSAFYLSNVEQYLAQDGLWMAFCGNVARLPMDETSTFIFSQGGGGGRGRGSLLSWYRPMLVDVQTNKCEATGAGSLVR
jgi:hypothetical protein